jgi:thiosulfate/3-mercaptopyruvate sulfurtransferase
VWKDVFTTLIDTATLAAHLLTPDWVVVDCRFALDDPGWGEREYAAGHVPGAVYAHLDRDLAGVKTGTNGRHPLPDPATAVHTFGRWGISAGVQVVAYDQDAGSYASRLWWMLRWLGHDSVAVLDGGLARWIADRRPTDAAPPAQPARVFTAVPRRGMAVSTGEMLALMGDPTIRLIDARAPERYRGEVETLDRIAGHIPGAANRFFKRNVNEDGTFRTAAALREEWRQATAGAEGDQVVCYCGSGVTACHNLLALEHAGMTGARLYPGSWSEWSSDPSRPIARTAAPDPPSPVSAPDGEPPPPGGTPAIPRR